MKFYILAIMLVATLAIGTLAEPEPESAKASRYRAAQIIDDDDDDDDEANEDTVDNSKQEILAAAASDDASKKGDASSGRLFLRKFLLFRNMFGNNQQQPVIPIIINGAGTNTAATSPATSTITIPSGSGTITTTPTTTTGTNRQQIRKPQQVIPREGYEDSSENESETANDEAAAVVDEQTIAAALAAGADEYVVTDQEIKGTSDAKANRAPARVNLRRRGAKKGQVVSVRVPPKYRRYFKSGQRVIMNNKNRPAKRRVTKKRINRNRNRNNNNSNKRRRVVAG